MKQVDKNGWLSSLNRNIRYRLVIPMLRSKNAPEHTARGVMVGMLWAMTPTVGIQMAMILLTWFITRRYFNWDFSLVNGLAWTWVTNVFTMIPIYYVFFLTGQIMLGNLSDLSGYDSFKQVWGIILTSDQGSWEVAKLWFSTLVSELGWPMLVGSIPWSLLSGWLSYRLSLNFVRRYRNRRDRKIQQRGQHLLA